MRPVHPSSRQPPQSVYQPASQSHCLSIPRPVHPSSPPICHPHPSIIRTIRPPSRHSVLDSSVRHPTCQSQSDCPSPSNHLHTILPRPSDHPPPSHHLYDAPISPSACPSPADCLTTTTTRPPIRPSSPTIHCTHDSNQSLAVMNGEQSHTIHRPQDSSQSLAVVNGEQSRKAKKFHRAFTNYDLLLHALDASSIYLHDLRGVAPPKSGEDAHITCGKCDFGGATLNNPSLGCSYVIPRLWDPGGVSSSPNAPRDQSRTIAPSRYPYGPRTGYLVNLPNLQ